MLVYHGSNLAIETPRLVSRNRFLDFGFGFYTTTNRDQAIDFSFKVERREGGGIPAVSVYRIDEALLADGLGALRFSAPDELWLDYVALNRSGSYEGPEHDVVIGPVANDDVFTTVTLYLAGALTKQQALEALKVKRLFDQYVWKTEAALRAIGFVEAFDAREAR